MSADNGLITATAVLARAAPREWQGFLTELQKHVAEAKDQCVSAPLDSLQKAQGRAQGCRDLLTLFENAIQKAARIVQGRNTPTP